MPPEDPRFETRYRIQSKATGMQLGLIDPPGWSEGRPHVTPVAPDLGSIWVVSQADIGFRLMMVEEPLPWEGPPHFGSLDSNAERQVYVLPPNDGAYQKWRFLRDDEGYHQLVNVATSFALDGTAEDIYTHHPNDGAYQRWGFFPA